VCHSAKRRLVVVDPPVSPLQPLNCLVTEYHWPGQALPAAFTGISRVDQLVDDQRIGNHGGGGPNLAEGQGDPQRARTDDGAKEIRPVSKHRSSWVVLWVSGPRIEGIV
jgi:hypothetical protein